MEILLAALLLSGLPLTQVCARRALPLPRQHPPVAGAHLRQGQALDDFYKFKKGTTWTYKRVEDGAERKITAAVASDDDGLVKLDWKDPDKDGASNVTWSVENNLLKVEAKKDGDGIGLTFFVLKGDAKKDDAWASVGGEFTHKGTAEVTVPAGKYKDAVWTRFRTSGDGDVTVDFYLVPKVGLVKIEINAVNGGNTFELSEFKEAKK
jgi:hypothetical protein